MSVWLLTVEWAVESLITAVDAGMVVMCGRGSRGGG